MRPEVGELREEFRRETELIASATSMTEDSSVSQDRGPAFLLEACLGFCQAESIPVLELQPDSQLWPWLPMADPEHPQPASWGEGPAVPAAYVGLGWKPIPVGPRVLNRAADAEM